MNRLVARLGVLALPALLAGQVLAQQVQQAQTQSAQTSRVEEAAHKEPVTASKPAAARKPARASKIAPAAPHALFGVFPIATRSDDARKLVEKSIDQYENVLLDNSVASRAIVIKSSGVFAPNPDVRGLESDRLRAPHPQHHRRSLRSP